MPGLHDDDEEDYSSYALSDLENGQHERLLNTGGDSDTDNYSSSDPGEKSVPSGSPLTEKILGIRLSAWINGPQPPRPHKINPIGGPIQTVFADSLKRWVPGTLQRALLALAFILIWFLSFILVIHIGYSRDGARVRLDCTSSLWPDTQTCGLDGAQCLPFDNHTIPFRCPAYCRDVPVLEPYTIGAEEINYRSLVIGGQAEGKDASSSIYRGDSFICAAAIHAGVISEESGGCGSVSLIGAQEEFVGSESNGIMSMGFNASFPMSYQFIANESSTCTDPQWQAFGVSLTFTTVLSLFTTSSALFFGSVFSSVFFQTALASDTPDFASYDDVISSALGRFLPAAFVGLCIYLYCVRYTFRNLQAHFEKTVLWLGGCWFSAVGQELFDKIPISRLTPHDLQQQPGAIPALSIILSLIVVIAITQILAFRTEGRLPRYLALYAVFIFGLAVLVSIPRLRLRLHHYVFALLLLPGTTMQTRPSLLYQGFLVGLFINGIARWGFDSIAQTDLALRGNAKLGSALPVVPAPIIEGNNITFSLGLDKGYDGFSVVVNDVERFRALGDEEARFVWTKAQEADVEYFRFGFVKYGRLGGVELQDYTNAGIWSVGDKTYTEAGTSEFKLE
ncbi:putative lccl domain containing protein [Venturia nashicola]|nr:putative lccl domain containing protein [Venturia nashicola]